MRLPRGGCLRGLASRDVQPADQIFGEDVDVKDSNAAARVGPRMAILEFFFSFLLRFCLRAACAKLYS